MMLKARPRSISCSSMSMLTVAQGQVKARSIVQLQRRHIKLTDTYKMDRVLFTASCNTLVNIRRFAGIYAYCRYFIDRKW